MVLNRYRLFYSVKFLINFNLKKICGGDLREIQNIFCFVFNIFFFIFFFSFRPFPLVRGGHSVSSFSTSFCLQCPSPSHQLPSYLLLPHLKIFSLVSLFSSFLVTPFPSSFFLHTLGLSS